MINQHSLRKGIQKYFPSNISVPGIFFIGWFCLGLWIYSDYGVSFDEEIERTTGAVNLQYLSSIFGYNFQNLHHAFPGIESIGLESYKDRAFGPLFGIFSVLLELILNIGNGSDQKAIYEFRHLLTFLISFCGGIAIYAIALRRFDSWRVGLLAVLMFILTPRFFAESFYNNKDLVFLAFFAIATNATLALLLTPSINKAIGAGLFCALASDTRITGVLLPALFMAIVMLNHFQSNALPKLRLRIVIIFSAAFIFCVVFFWPWLWADPFARFQEALAIFSRWTRSDGDLLLFGLKMRSTALPWFYIPAWMLVTIPLAYLSFYLVGFFQILQRIVTQFYSSVVVGGFRLWGDDKDLQDFFFLGLIMGPILAVIMFNSVVYDGWRHLYFTYPAFLMICIRGYFELLNFIKIKALITLVRVTFAVSIFYNLCWIIHYHPFQNVFFNSIAGKGWNKNFDVDYWGLSSRQMLEWIARNDNRNLIHVYPSSFMNLNLSANTLRAADLRRIVIVDSPNKADYLVTNYRNSENLDQKRNRKFVPIFSFDVQGEIIASIYKFKPEVFIGKPIVFSDQDINTAYLVRRHGVSKGWSAIESWGSWSSGSSSEVNIPLPSGGAHIIRFDVWALVVKNHPSQHVKIWVNGVFNQEVVLQKYETIIEVEIPIFMQEDDFLRVEFEFPDAISPKQVGLNEDLRMLAIGLRKITFF